MTQPRLVFVALKTSDLEAAVRFYRDVVGVPLEAAYTEPREAPDAAWLGGSHYEHSWREGGYLHFALFPTVEAEEPSSARIGFFVEDVERVRERALAGGIPVVSEPRDEPWGRTAGLADPDGNIVTITQR